MPTNPEELRTTLDNLHKQLADVEQTDPSMHDQLARALAEIQSALDGMANSGPASRAKSAYRQSLVQRLREVSTHFEASHPSLASNIGGLIDTLGRSGI